MKNNKFSSNFEKKTHSSGFFQLPDFLFFDQPYAAMSNDAKLLYALLLRRFSLSNKNHAETGGWKDEYGVFLLCARSEMMRLLNCSENKVRRLIAELQNCGLLMEKRQGLNRPNRIYLCQVSSNSSAKVEVPEPSVLAGQKPSKQRSNQIENKAKTIELSSPDTCSFSLQTNSQIELDKVEDQTGKILAIQKKSRNFSIQTSYLRICQQNSDKTAMQKCCIAYLLDIFADADSFCLQGAYIMGHYRTPKEISDRLEKIDEAALDVLLEALECINQPIRHPRAYLLTALYQAPENIALYPAGKTLRSDCISLTKKEKQPFVEGELLAKFDMLSAI